MNRATIRGIATALALGALVTSAAACDPEATDPEARTKQEKPVKKPVKKPVRVTPRDDGVPRLTGDRQKDSAAVKAALVKLKTEYDHNARLVSELTKMQAEKKGRISKAEARRLDERVAKLKAKNDVFKARAEKLQDLLGKLRK